MNPRASSTGRTSGIVLTELLCASALAVLALAAILVTFIMVQRSFIASLYQVNAQGDQHRVFSYLRRDLRGASSVQVTAQGTGLTLTLPARTTPTLNLNLGAALLSLLSPPQNAPATTTVRYYREGTSILREGDGITAELSGSATRFQVELSGSSVRIEASFQPRYSVGRQISATTQSSATASVHLLNAVSR